MTRKGLFLAACCTLAVVSSSWAQQGYIVRRPPEPALNVLDRLNLKLRWATALPMNGSSDTVVIVQILGNQVFAQLRSGVLVVIDTGTGDTQWSYVFPKRGSNIYPVAVTPSTVFIVNGVRLYALDRRNGFKVFEQSLPSTPQTGPAADAERVFVPLSNNRIIIYSHTTLILPTPGKPPSLPDPPPPAISLEPIPIGETVSSSHRSPSVTMLHRLTPPYALNGQDSIPSFTMSQTLIPPYKIEGNRSPGVTILGSLHYLGEQTDILIRDKYPTKLFEVLVDRGMDFVPLISKELIVAPTNHQVVMGYSKLQVKTAFEFPTGSAITAPPGQHQDMAYIPTADSNLFALNLETYRASWRYTGGGAMDRKPFVTDDSVYIAGARSGITRIAREEGEKIWHHNGADRILAMNPKFIYGTDRSGRLHVIDRARGLGLTTYDIRDYGVPIVNEENDRLFLVGNNGILLCLHDKDYRTPVATLKPPKKEAGPRKAPEPVMEPEPKKEEPKKEPEPKKEEAKKEPEPKKDEEKKE